MCSTASRLFFAAPKSTRRIRPAYSITNSTTYSPDGSLDTHIHRSHDAQQRRPCRYFRVEIRRHYPRIPKLYLTTIQFLRRLAQRQVACFRRVPQDSQLLHLHGEWLHRVFVAESLRLFCWKCLTLQYENSMPNNNFIYTLFCRHFLWLDKAKLHNAAWF